MKRRFNDTGLCVANMHYMVDTSDHIKKIFDGLVEYGEYFSITGGRQYGKTTSIALLTKLLEKREDYLLIRTSFEDVGDMIYKNEETFSKGFLMHLYYDVKRCDPQLAERFREASEEMRNYKTLSDFISRFCEEINKKVVLIIDEVDQSSNNNIFLRFLGLLRDKFLKRNEGNDTTFHSVVLAGVHDIKTLKFKIHEGKETKLNSPWNIAADLNVDLSFKPEQIISMLDDYLTENVGVNMPKQEVADRLYYYTSGYPYLVSKMCKIIDEIILPERLDKNWYIEDVEEAFRKITYSGYTTTLFQSIAKNIVNSPKLYDFIYDLVIDNAKKPFAVDDPIVCIAKTYSIIKDKTTKCQIHNRIFEQRLYDLLISIMGNAKKFKDAPDHPEYYQNDDIDLEYILLRFQTFFKEHYSHSDKNFLEREGRLVFLSYLQPIINGNGYVFKEPVTGEERRMDIALTYNKKRYVIELKVWHGDVYHQKGMVQMNDYLDLYSLKNGYMLIFNFNKNKEFKHETVKYKDKELFTVWV